jgi:hypothetical protein
MTVIVIARDADSAKQSTTAKLLEHLRKQAPFVNVNEAWP